MVHTALQLTMVLVHAQELTRMGIRAAFAEAGMVQVVLELDGLDHLRSSWPDTGVKVVLLHYCGAIALLLDSLLWIKRRDANAALMVLGPLTPRVSGQLADAGVRALFQDTVRTDVLLQAVTILGAGGVHPSAVDARLHAPRKQEQGKAKGGGPTLTDKQLECLLLLCDPAGLKYWEIADRMGIGHRTVEQHVKSLCTLFGVGNRPGLVNAAHLLGYVKR